MEPTRQRILVVDDEKNIRLTVSQALKPLDYAVDTAVNGEDALQQLAARPYQLVLLDLRLPGLDGVEVLRRIAADHPAVRVIIISAHGTVDNAVAVMKLGAIDFIRKPFTPNELRTLVQEVLDRNRVAAHQQADYESLLKLARHFIGVRDLAAALAETHQAVGLDPERPEAFNLLGVLYELSGDHNQAMKHYRVALDLDPTYEPARLNMNQGSPAGRAAFRPNLG